eukprot:SAG31_NODE_140_length_22731_cov_10.941410_3_plen_118_part_00
MVRKLKLSEQLVAEWTGHLYHRLLRLNVRQSCIDGNRVVQRAEVVVRVQHEFGLPTPDGGCIVLRERRNLKLDTSARSSGRPLRAACCTILFTQQSFDDGCRISTETNLDGNHLPPT